MARRNRYLSDRAYKRRTDMRMRRDSMEYGMQGRVEDQRRDSIMSKPLYQSRYQYERENIPPMDINAYNEGMLRKQEMNTYGDGHYGHPIGYGYGVMYDSRRGDYSKDYAYESDSRKGRRDYRDYADDYTEKNMEMEYEEDLKKWIEKLKRKDKFGMTYEQVIQKAKSMGVKFEEFSELEFYAIYLAMASDYSDITNDPIVFFKMAKDFLEDDDIKVDPSEKVCIYLYKIVMGEE